MLYRVEGIRRRLKWWGGGAKGRLVFDFSFSVLLEDAALRHVSIAVGGRVVAVRRSDVCWRCDRFGLPLLDGVFVTTAYELCGVSGCLKPTFLSAGEFATHVEK